QRSRPSPTACSDAVEPTGLGQRRLVHARHRASGRVGGLGERRIPRDRRRRRARNRLAARYRPGTGRAGEQLLEDPPVEVRLPALRRVDREAAGGGDELALAEMGFVMGLESIDPAIADAIAALLLLAP